MSKHNTPETNEELNVTVTPDETSVQETAEKTEEKKPSEKKRGSSFNKRNFKRGTMAVVLTVIFAAALVFVNIIVGLLSERFNATADLSAGGM